MKKEVSLAKKIDRSLWIFLAVLALLHLSASAYEGGSITGKITDPQGAPISEAYLYISSPAQIGVKNYTTSRTGFFGFLNLSSGIYTLIVEKPGFKTITVENIVIAGSGNANLSLEMETSAIEEELTIRPAKAALDTRSSSHTFLIDRSLLTRIPLPRDFTHALGFVPGLVFSDDLPGPFFSVHGAPVRDTLVAQDGVDVSDPLTGGLMARVNIDLIGEVTVETAGHRAEQGPVGGGFVRIQNRSGGNDVDGGLSIFHTNHGFAKSLWTSEELEDMDVGEPAVDRRHWDLAFTLGGAAIKDIGWFFTNVRFLSRSRKTPFTTWYDPTQGAHYPYDWSDKDLSGFLKLSTRINTEISGYAEIHFARIKQPVYTQDIAWNRPLESTHAMTSERFFSFRAGMTYLLDQNTYADLFLGATNLKRPLYLNSEGAALPGYYDLGTRYYWGSGPYNEIIKRKRFRGGASITRLADRILGASHELVAGGEYETMAGESSVWIQDNLSMNYLNGSPYFYGEVESPSTGEIIGAGLIDFSVIPYGMGQLVPKHDLRRLGVFVQDTFSFAGRVTLSLGLRFDHSSVQMPPISKGASGNVVSYRLGEEVIEPTYGINPFDAFLLGRWNGAIVWNSLSPRAGLSIAVLGEGETVLKGSFARYPEYLGIGYSDSLIPLQPDTPHRFIWYDEDGDGLVGQDDSYGLVTQDYRIYFNEYYKKRVDDDLKAPVTEEWTAGLEQKIGKDMVLSFRYISKKQRNIIGRVLYEPEDDIPWYSTGTAQEGWWVPFTTTVPGTGTYPDTPVTVYFPSSEAPAPFDRHQNVPELQRAYKAFELTLRKRWADNWQFAGSVVWSRATGTIGLAPPWATGLSKTFLTPNSFVFNPVDSRLDLDRPVAIRLMGTARLPWNFYLSLYFQSTSGLPWARSVAIVPPESWAAENNVNPAPISVLLESPGTRRKDSWRNLDLRFEKEFLRSGKTRFAIYFDILNLLGDKYSSIDLNDGGYWYPAGEGTSEGERVLSGTYEKYLFVRGVRTFQLNLSLKF